jgi:hypothetical protein
MNMNETFPQYYRLVLAFTALEQSYQMESEYMKQTTFLVTHSCIVNLYIIFV